MRPGFWWWIVESEWAVRSTHGIRFLSTLIEFADREPSALPVPLLEAFIESAPVSYPYREPTKRGHSCQANCYRLPVDRDQVVHLRVRLSFCGFSRVQVRTV